ncbi:putative pentatricopeptide repeat-containing protein At3g13770, mitochondrial [Andrographis paniculata]|uniref:putative pentatricopeptide repeat-containing protein At3g13770, mitochondrial n=1 Tax=Andrographis paniculata TaxID=175694 RepID=UPI0021E9966B|nr:putative pentatricopeptide repeat-containing protein At3g13770, mitochondrial [Andrographis paniculata]
MFRRVPKLIHSRIICIPSIRLFATMAKSTTKFSPCSSFPEVHDFINNQLHEVSMPLDMKFRDYDALLNECVRHKSLRGGQRVQAHMIKSHYLPPVYLRTRLVVMYIKCEALVDARKVFDQMPERNVVSWTAMISGYNKTGRHSEALNLFLQMLRSGTDPNEFTFATVLTSCVGEHGFKHGTQIHSLLIKSPFESHIYVGSSLLDLYAKAGRINEARIIFEGLPNRDVVSCTALISGYTQLGLDEEAVDLFCTLQRESMPLNYVTYTSLLTALSGLATFEYGRQVHARVLRSEPSINVVLHNALIDMYSKCGDLSYARRIFDKMPERTVISWNAMLAGYGKHGDGKAVVDLYNVMTEEEEQICPDSTTLLTVLSGCSHGGMEKLGLEIFDTMNGNDRANLGIEHYGCIVDLLGRAGQLEKALKFIEKMPYEPNAAIWGSLLGACKAHKNLRVGTIAGNRLLEIEPENAGNYVILCNLYASDRRWDKVRKLREMMKQKAVTKAPGKSWIEVGQMLHTFYSNDRSHPRKEEIVQKVMEILDKVKAAGYNPDVSSVLHDVDEEQKERLVLGHSEKLALAFGMMSVSEEKPLRIMKNLRICVDCHNFAKFVSEVFGREIVVRDKSRFHHIVHGVCSCSDYW